MNGNAPEPTETDPVVPTNDETTSNPEVLDLTSALPTRWEIELEFVQSLCNIQYLNHLAQQNYLKDPEFINYLRYLNYWKQPENAKHLVYPNCLHILTLLQNEQFRQDIVNQDFMNSLMNDMVKRWQDQEQPISFDVASGNNPDTDGSNSTAPAQESANGEPEQEHATSSV